VNKRRWLLLLFLITGLVSLGIWWRGKAVHGKPGLFNITGPLEVSYIVDPTPVPENGLVKQTADFVRSINTLVSTASGEYAFYVFRLDSGFGYGMRENEVLPAASIMKVPVMVAVSEAVANGRMNLDDTYTLEEADRATGSGPLQFELSGKTYKISDLLNYLGKNSDNTAWLMFNRRLGNQLLEDVLQEMQMMESSYQNLTTTARDVARMFAYIYRGKAGGETGKQAIWSYLTDSIYEDRISVGIPDGVDLAHKVGTDTDVWADAGIIVPKSGKIEPFILVILNRGVDRNQATWVVPEITRKIWDFESRNSGL
jgi:beta-lactamase class A